MAVGVAVEPRVQAASRMPDSHRQPRSGHCGRRAGCVVIGILIPQKQIDNSPSPTTLASMPSSLKILCLSAEVAPFAKTGGLGDVAGSLPKALRALGHDVRVVMPAYQSLEAKGRAGELDAMPWALNVPLGIGTLRVPAGVFQSQLPGSDVPVYFIAQRSLFDRPEIYDYADDSYRFSFFSRAALDLTLALDWRPDIVHAHDWHTAPAVTWLPTAGQAHDRYPRLPR